MSVSLGDLVVTVGAKLDGFRDAMGEVSSTLGSLGETAEKFLNQFEGLGTKLVEGLAIGALTTAVFDAGETVENTMTQISRSTGATGTDLETFGEIFKTTFADATQSASDLGGGLALLSQRTGATEEDLKSLLEINSKLAQVTGQQLVPVIDETQKVFAAWGVTVAEQPAKLDALLVISQKTGISLGALTGTMQTAGATLRTMGVNFNDAAALMANFETHGVNSGRVMMTLNQALVTLTKEGFADPQAELGKLIQSIIGAKNPVDALNLASVDLKGRGLIPLVDALRQGVTNIDALRDAANGSIGAIQKSADSSDKFGEELTKLKNQTEILLAPLGVKLVEALASIVKLAGGAEAAIGSLAESFAALPVPVQIAAGAVAALSASMLVFSAESVASSIAAIGTFSTAMITEFTASITGAIAAVQLFTLDGLVAAFVAPFASISAFITLIGEGGLAGAFTGLGVAARGLAASALPALTGILSTLAVATLGVAAAFAGWKFGEWLRENIPLAQKFGDTVGDWILKIPGVSAAIEHFSGVSKLTAETTANLTATTQALSAKLAEHGIVVNRGMMSLEEYAKALQDAAKGATDTIQSHDGATAGVGRLEAALKQADKALTEVEKAFKAGAASADDVRAAQEKVFEITQKLHPEYTALFGTINENLPTLDQLGKLTLEGAAAMVEAKNSTNDWTAVLHLTNAEIQMFAGLYPHTIELMQKWSDELTANNPLLNQNYVNMKALDTIIKDSQKDFADQAKAIQQQTQAWGPLHDEHVLGIQDTSELKKRMDEADGAFQRVSTAVDDQGHSLYSLTQITQAHIADLRTQIDYHKALGENTDALQAQMEALGRTLQRNSTFWTDLGRAMNSITLSAGKNLADAIVGLFSNNGVNDALDKQAADLQAAMAQETASYQESTDNIKAQMQSVTETNASELAKQLADLTRSMSDKATQYARDVEDLNAAYAKTTESIKDQAAQKELDYKHWVESQKLALKGLEGDNSASARKQRDDINLQLKQRGEDMDLYRSQEQEHLADAESDLQTSLQRKAADYAQAQIDITTQQQQVTDNAKSQLNDQLANLQKQLDDANKKYDAYTSDNKTKLQTIKDNHQTVLTKIGDMFSGVFTTAGTALATFVSEQLVGSLFKELGKLTDKILPDLGTALGNIFGKVTGVTGQSVSIPGLGALGGDPGGLPGVDGAPGIDLAAGGGGGGAASALGSVTGIVGAVGSVATAISSIVGNFQMAHQETTLNAIELNTRVTAILLGSQNASGTGFQDADSLKGAMITVRQLISDNLPGIWNFTHVAASMLQDVIKFDTASMAASLRSIDAKTVAPAQTQAKTNAITPNVTIQVYGSSDPALTAKLVMDQLKTVSPVFS